MPKPFAMWIERTVSGRFRDRQQVLATGVALGRAPDLGESMVVVAPMFEKRVRCTASVATGRGGDPEKLTLGLESPGVPPDSLEGAALIEDGRVAFAGGALLKRSSSPLTDSGRFRFANGDVSWGLVRTMQRSLHVLCVGAGIPYDHFWNELVDIETGRSGRICVDELEPERRLTGVWTYPAIHAEPRDEQSISIVVRRVGPARVARARVGFDGDEREARVYPQAHGLTQFVVHHAGPPAQSVDVTFVAGEAA